MSHPARDPRSGIDGKANAAEADALTICHVTAPPEAERMSHPARDPRSGIDGKANAAGGRYDGLSQVRTAVRPSA